MALIYVRSTDGSNSDDGSTWALAKADLTGAAAIDVAGDSIFVSDNHAETTSSVAVTIALAGTLASYTRLLAVDDSAEPPTALSSNSASVTTTSAGNINITGAAYQVHGINFNVGSGNVTVVFAPGASNNAHVMLTSCRCMIVSTGTGARINCTGTGTRYELKDFHVQFANASQGFAGGSGAVVVWSGGSVLAGGTSPTTLIVTPSNSIWFIEGVDLSNCSAGVHLTGIGGTSRVVFRNCKLPSGWSGSLVTGTIATPLRAEMHNCNAGDVNYSIRVQDYTGLLVEETTIVRTGARTDGTTNVSWKIVTTANAEFTLLPFETPEIRFWNETVGSAITVKIPFVHDDATDAKTNEIGMDAWYAGTSGFPLYLLATTDENQLGSFANHADATSDDNWGTTGFSNENEQRLSLTFTPQEKGWVNLKVKVYEASKTVYVDPDPQIS